MKMVRKNQQGFSLFMVMIIMIVIALLVVVTSQSTSTESRLSANEADRKFALSQAEVGLRDAEAFLSEKYNQLVSGDSISPLKFTENCQNGLCAPLEKVEWERDEDKKIFVIDANVNGKIKSKKAAWERENIFSKNSAKEIKGSNKTGWYIIEYLGQRNGDSGSIHDYFRVTSRSQGKNAQTQVTLQSFVEMTRNP